MLKSKELRAKAWVSLKGKYWMAFLAVLISSLLVSVGTSMISTAQSIATITTTVDPSEMDAVMSVGAGVLLAVAFVLCVIGFIISVFVGGAAEVGLANYFVKNTESKPALSEIFSGFKVKYKRNVGAILLMGIKLALWSILFVIPGIIKSYEYAMIPYLLADNAEITTKEAFKLSKEMMKGNKWRLFKLNFSFIGWIILCFVTFGVGAIFLMPYISAANAEFYAELKNR